MAASVAVTPAITAPTIPVDGIRNEALISELRHRFDDFKPQRPVKIGESGFHPGLHRELTHGWMLPLLLQFDECLWQRWDYWRQCYEGAGVLPNEPIPRLDLLSTPHPATRRMLEASLNCIPQHGDWRTWGSWQYFDYCLSWLLFGLGHKGQSELPTPPAGSDGASDRLHQVFCLDAMLLWPHDYFGDLLCESSYGKQQGFYPTPHTICEFMTQMVCAGKQDSGADRRTDTVCDPCVGTGRFLLHASNHSLRLYGLEIDPVLCKATLVNGYFYSPWLVRPIPWLDGELAALEQMAGDTKNGIAKNDFAENIDAARELSDFIAASAPPHAQSYLRDTEHDHDGQRAVAPLLKRKKRTADPTQGSLF